MLWHVKIVEAATPIDYRKRVIFQKKRKRRGTELTSATLLDCSAREDSREIKAFGKMETVKSG